MNRNALFSVLLMVAVIASPVAFAHAGGSGAGGPNGEVFLQCYNVADGPNPPHLLDVNDQFIDPTAEKIGKLKLMCTFPSVSVLNTETPGTDLNFVDTLASNRHINCYEVTDARALTKGQVSKAHANVIYNDTFFAGNNPPPPTGPTTDGVEEPTGQTAKVDGPSKFICVFSNKTCLDGFPPPTGP